jgi:hypothetical protein
MLDRYKEFFPVPKKTVAKKYHLIKNFRWLKGRLCLKRPLNKKLNPYWNNNKN